MQKRKQHKTDIEKLRRIVPPDKYNDFLRCIQLDDLYIKDVKANLFSKIISGNISINLIEDFQLVENKNSLAKIEVVYKINAKNNNRRIFIVNLKYVVILKLSRDDIPKEFFELYKELSLPLHTFPYCRECVNSLISRMGLPNLILPLRKFLIGE